MARSRLATTTLVSGLALSTALIAQEAGQLTNVSFLLNGQEQSISQANDINPTDVAALFDRSAACAGICLAPMSAAEGVATVGELDVIDFVTEVVANGDGLLIDSRAPEAREVGAIVSSINLPGSLLGEDNPFRNDILLALGAREFEGIFNFADAMPLMVFDAGPASQDAAQLINTLVSLGYPEEKIQYYRGGMQVWAALGLNMEEL